MEQVKTNYEQFIDLCRLGNENAILSFLDKGVCVNETNESGISLLHVVSTIGTENVLNSLLSKGANVDKCSNIGWTPLMCAARNGKLSLVQKLIDHGAEVSCRNKFGISALSAAAASGNKEVIEILLNALRERILSQDDIIYSLRIAALHGHSRILKLLLSSNSLLINVGDEYGITPLMLASAGGHEEVAKILLNSGANCNQKNCQQFTALDIASANRHEKLEHLLKDKTKERSDHDHNEHLYFNIGSDLIEGYGWSSVCTPKLWRGAHNNSLNSSSKRVLENDFTSPNHKNSLTSKISYHETDPNSNFLSSLFIPVYQSLHNNSSFSTHSLKNELSIAVNSSPNLPFSSCISSSPFNIPKTFPSEKHCSDNNLKSNCPYPVNSMFENSIIEQNNYFDNPCASGAYDSKIQTSCKGVKSVVHEESNGKIWRTGKVEKWLRSLLALWQKKVRANRIRQNQHEKSSTQSETSQNSANTYETNSAYKSQGREGIDANMKELATSSSTLNNLLRNLNLQSYVPLFQQHEIDMDSFVMLSQEDLEEMGINSPKSKNKLLKVIMTFKGEN